MVCGGAIKDAGGVGDDHARSFGGRQIDVVEPDRDIRDDLQLRSGGGDEIGIDALGEGDYCRASARDARFELSAVRRCFRPDPQRSPERVKVVHRAISEKS